MSRAYGWNASLLIAEESKYGILPESGYRQIPFISTSLDSEQSLVSSNVLGLGRDPTQPFQDVINVDGDMAVPVDMRNMVKSYFRNANHNRERGWQLFTRF